MILYAAELDHEAGKKDSRRLLPRILQEQGEGISLSVTHTGTLWACLVAEDGPLGLDLERVREVPYEKLARRFFTPREAEVVEEQGRDLFFRLWTAKEAWVKYTRGELYPVLSGTCLIDGTGQILTEYGGAVLQPLTLFLPECKGTICCPKERREEPLTLIRLEGEA